jgi:ankyrin repeat protein
MNGVRQLPAIKRAIKANDVDAVHRLLTGDPYLVIARGQGWTPLQDAAFQARTQIVKVMLAEGSGITPVDVAHALHHAVQLPRIDPEVVEALLATGHVCEPFVALYRGDLAELGRSLRAAPALIDAKDAEGCPPLLRAAENAQEEMVRLLLAHGADVEGRGPYGTSPLSSCACNQVDRRKRSKTLRLLLESGANVNGRTSRGRTALFSAATAGWGPEDSVKVLLEHGADPNIRNDEGRTVLEEVLLYPSARSQRVATLLREGGAQGNPPAAL